MEQKHVEDFTAGDYSTPWLTVVCYEVYEVMLEE